MATVTAVKIVTVTVSGVFTILPNRTIAIAKATIDPSLLPTPIYTETPPISNSTSGPPFTSSSKQNEVDKNLLIGVLCGIILPIFLAIIATVILRYFTWRLAKVHGIPFSPFATMFKRPNKSSRATMPSSQSAMAPLTSNKKAFDGDGGPSTTTTQVAEGAMLPRGRMSTDTSITWRPLRNRTSDQHISFQRTTTENSDETGLPVDGKSIDTSVPGPSKPAHGPSTLTAMYDNRRAHHVYTPPSISNEEDHPVSPRAMYDKLRAHHVYTPPSISNEEDHPVSPRAMYDKRRAHHVYTPRSIYDEEERPTSPPANVQEVINERGEVYYTCRNHPGASVDPNTWICSESGEYLDEELRVRRWDITP